jgi:adenylosuccinate synthase
VNGFDALAVTKLDVLDELAEIPVCTGYRLDGRSVDFPADAGALEACEPVYDTLPGWHSPTSGIREWLALPDAARRYVERLAEIAGTPIGLVSTGPDRADSIVRGDSAIASWFD